MSCPGKFAPTSARLAACFVLALCGTAAQALPAYARQTGQNCVACHVSFPELTSYGRWFKLSGYTIGERQTIPLAMMAQVGRTQIRNNDDGTGTGTAVTARDRQLAFNGASVFVAGKATDDLGAFVQWTLSTATTPTAPAPVTVARQHRCALGRPHDQSDRR